MEKAGRVGGRGLLRHVTVGAVGICKGAGKAARRPQHVLRQGGVVRADLVGAFQMLDLVLELPHDARAPGLRQGLRLAALAPCFGTGT